MTEQMQVGPSDTPPQTPQQVVILGGGGQVAHCLHLTAPTDAVAHTLLSRTDCDITNPDAVAQAIRGADVVINTAAYTAVDAAEADQARAAAVNAHGAGVVARACANAAIPLIHLSTDYVFGAGQWEGKPIPADAPAAPASVYGRTKWEGEQLVRESGCRAVIVRTAWVYSGNWLVDHKDFVSTMLRLEASVETVSVVNDQVGCPTFAVDLARGLWQLVGLMPKVDGVVTVHGVGSGQASWWELARAVFEEVGADPQRVRAVSTQEYPTAAVRPAWSVLDTGGWVELGLDALPHWRDAVRRAVQGCSLGG